MAPASALMESTLRTGARARALACMVRADNDKGARSMSGYGFEKVRRVPRTTKTEETGGGWPKNRVNMPVTRRPERRV